MCAKEAYPTSNMDDEAVLSALLDDNSDDCASKGSAYATEVSSNESSDGFEENIQEDELEDLVAVNRSRGEDDKENEDLGNVAADDRLLGEDDVENAELWNVAAEDHSFEENGELDENNEEGMPMEDVDHNGNESRKRVRNIAMHKKVVRKRKLEAGEAHFSSSSKQIPAKTFSNKVCGCKNKCNDKLTEDRRKAIFQHYYGLEWSLKTAFIIGQILSKSKARTYTKVEISRKSHTHEYFFATDSGVEVKVCKSFFKDTLQVSDGKISNALKFKKAGTPALDRRGKHTPHNKSKEMDVKFATDFIKSVPSYVSHYSRNDNIGRKYLQSHLNVNKLYGMYKGKCVARNKPPLSLFMFRHIFNTKFNLHFHRPHTDTCLQCDRFIAKNKVLPDGPEKVELKREHDKHLLKAEAAKTLKNSLTVTAKTDPTKAVLVFDLQKTLPTPVLTTGIVYYKRQMWTYNLGIHDEVSNTGFMYVWSENVASRGPQEIASCLMHHIKDHVPECVTNLTLYSDSCGGQNRNIKMSLMLSHILEKSPSLQIIDQKFFVPGHSFSSCDQDFGIIEKAKKYHPEVYVPDDWVRVIETAKIKEPKFVVKHMRREDFVSSQSLEHAITNRKVCINGQKVSWLGSSWIRIEKGNLRHLKFNSNYSDESTFMEVDLTKRSRGRPMSLGNIELQPLFVEARKLSKEKLKDLFELMQFIPPTHHPFYRSLVADDDAEDFGLVTDNDEDEDE